MYKLGEINCIILVNGSASNFVLKSKVHERQKIDPNHCSQMIGTDDAWNSIIFISPLNQNEQNF